MNTIYPTLYIFSSFEYPICQSCEKGGKNHSLFRRFHAFLSILLLEVNPKRVSTAFLSAVTTNPRKRVLLSMLLSARMTNKAWHGWDLLGFSSGAYILADKIWLNLAAFRQQASSRQKGPQRRKWAMTCLRPNMDLSSPSSVPQLRSLMCPWAASELCLCWQGGHEVRCSSHGPWPKSPYRLGKWVLDV